MATLNLDVSEELLAELRDKAAAEGKSVQELAGEALKYGLEDRAWQDLLEYGCQKGRESKYSEDDAPEVVREWRREQRSR